MNLSPSLSPSWRFIARYSLRPQRRRPQDPSFLGSSFKRLARLRRERRILVVLHGFQDSLAGGKMLLARFCRPLVQQLVGCHARRIHDVEDVAIRAECDMHRLVKLFTHRSYSHSCDAIQRASFAVVASGIERVAVERLS